MAETEQAATQTEEQNVEVQEAEFSKAQATDSDTGQEHLDMLLDIQLPVTVSLGKAEITLRQLLQLQAGSVLSLEKRIGEPVELIIQDVPFAIGDIVVVEDCYAVRIREILSNPAAAGLGDEDTES